VDLLPRIEARKLAVTVALAEFTELRLEISRRSRSQEQFIGLALTGTAAVGSVVVTHSQSRALLLAIAVVGPLLGFLYVDHARTIDRIGNYIREDLAPVVRGELRRLPEEAGPPPREVLESLLGWEQKVERERRGRILRGILLVATLFAFAIAPLGAGIAAKDSKDALSDFEFTSLRVAGIALALAFSVFWLLWLKDARRPSSTRVGDSGRGPGGCRTDESGPEPESPGASSAEPPR
jgi:hypothetical protein